MRLTVALLFARETPATLRFDWYSALYSPDSPYFCWRMLNSSLSAAVSGAEVAGIGRLTPTTLSSQPIFLPDLPLSFNATKKTLTTIVPWDGTGVPKAVGRGVPAVGAVKWGVAISNVDTSVGSSGVGGMFVAVGASVGSSVGGRAGVVVGTGDAVQPNKKIPMKRAKTKDTERQFIK